MAGTKAGGAKTKATLIAKLGGEERYFEYCREMGKKGGLNSRGGGFACKEKGKDGLTGAERAKIAGTLGGRRSGRNKMDRDNRGRAVRKDGKLFGTKEEE